MNNRKPDVVVAVDAKDFSTLGMIFLAMLVIGIPMTVIGAMIKNQAATYIGLAMAFIGAGFVCYEIFSGLKEDNKKIVEERSEAPKTAESIKEEKVDGMCPHCGKFIGYDGYEFCTYCGNRIVRK